MLRNKTVGVIVISGLLLALLMLPSCKKSESEPEEVTTPVEEEVVSEPVAEEVTSLAAEQVEEVEDTSNWEEIVLELPPSIKIGTPKEITVENLDKGDTPRPAILAPAGTTNVALGKPVTASESFVIIGNHGLITDGEKRGNDTYYVEYGADQQYVTIDLEAEYKIYAIAVWHYHQQERVYKDVIVQLADDAEMTQNARIIYNNDHDNSSGMGTGEDLAYIETNQGRLIDAGGGVARYVRLYSNGNTSDPFNHYIEVEVYGVEAE